MKIQTQFYPNGWKIKYVPNDRETPIHVLKRGRTIDKCATLARAQWQVAQRLVTFNVIKHLTPKDSGI